MSFVAAIVEPSTGSYPRCSSFRGDSPNLDLIRATAILSVFFAHLYFLTTGERQWAWQAGQIGVLIFFVHTSMVLMLSLERSRQTGGLMFRTFYLRRAFRIYPLSMICVTLAFLLHRSPNLEHPVRQWKLGEYLSNLALTTNLTYTEDMVGGLWTLPIEVQMYVVLPFLFLLARAFPIWLTALLWVGAVPLGLLVPAISQRLTTAEFAPCFLAGVLAWRMSLSYSRKISARWFPLAFAVIFPIFLMATPANHLYHRWTFCLALGLILPWFHEMARHTSIARAAHVIAKYSYGIYLSHYAVILFALGLPLPAALKWIVLFVLAVACPILMYHWIEQPMIRLGQRLSEFLRAGEAVYRRPVAEQRVAPN